MLFSCCFFGEKFYLLTRLILQFIYKLMHLFCHPIFVGTLGRELLPGGVSACQIQREVMRTLWKLQPRASRRPENPDRNYRARPLQVRQLLASWR